MSFTDENENLCKNPTDSEENYQTEEEVSDESVSGSITKLKNISIERNQKHFNLRKPTRTQLGRLNVSLRNRQLTGKNKSRKSVKRKNRQKLSVKGQNALENKIEVSQKGKRCRLGGKAKGKPPEEENPEKCDSDDDGDSSYYSRISLGYFQKFNDRSGASTSSQSNENPKTPKSVLKTAERINKETSEEMELLELQQWGMTGFVSSCTMKAEKLDRTEDIGPDKL